MLCKNFAWSAWLRPNKAVVCRVPVPHCCLHPEAAPDALLWTGSKLLGQAQGNAVCEWLGRWQQMIVGLSIVLITANYLKIEK